MDVGAGLCTSGGRRSSLLLYRMAPYSAEYQGESGSCTAARGTFASAGTSEEAKYQETVGGV